MSEHGLCCVECHANGTAQGEHAGEMVERERIIKLLEDPVVMSNWWSKVDKNIGLYGNLKEYVIALIKGENK